MKKNIVMLVARAIAASNNLSGQCFDNDSQEDVETRARNLVLNGYIVKGDPYGWSGSGGGICTILMEQRGEQGDCYTPADYYTDHWPWNAIEVSCAVSDAIDGVICEIINGAVMMVYEF